jgi:hypothetical protein
MESKTAFRAHSRNNRSTTGSSVSVVSAAWFGLIGVVVGGLISTVWSWLAVVRQELSDAMVAARLVDEDLRSVDLAIPGPSLDIKPETWSANRVALAKVLGREQWDAVAEVYRHQAQSETPADASPGELLRDARDALAPLVAGKRYIFPQRWRNALSFGHWRTRRKL